MNTGKKERIAAREAGLLQLYRLPRKGEVVGDWEEDGSPETKVELEAHLAEMGCSKVAGEKLMGEPSGWVSSWTKGSDLFCIAKP